MQSTVHIMFVNCLFCYSDRGNWTLVSSGVDPMERDHLVYHNCICDHATLGWTECVCGQLNHARHNGKTRQAAKVRNEIITEVNTENGKHVMGLLLTVLRVQCFF